MSDPEVFVEYSEDGFLTLKLKIKLQDIEKVDPVKEVNELKELIEGKEELIDKSRLRIYFDKYLKQDIEYILMKLLLYYALRR